MSLDRFGMYQPDVNPPYGTEIASDGASGLSGSGSPEGVVSASVGTYYWDITAHALYVKDTGTGNTGWLSAGGGSGTLTTLEGSGSPEGVTTGSPGWTYFDVTNEILYVKKTGTSTNTGWKNMAGA